MCIIPLFFILAPCYSRYLRISNDLLLKLSQIGTARTIRLAAFVLNKVATRKIPNIETTLKPAVLMKIDIEGSELEVLTDLLFSGGLQYVDKVVMEFHDYFKVLYFILYKSNIRVAWSS